MYGGFLGFGKKPRSAQRDNFVGHVGRLSEAESDELSRAQQQRHAQLRENELKVKQLTEEDDPPPPRGVVLYHGTQSDSSGFGCGNLQPHGRLFFFFPSTNGKFRANTIFHSYWKDEQHTGVTYVTYE